MTDKEIMDLLNSTSPLNAARQQFSHWMAKIEQADAQRRPPSSIQRRGMEFEAVRAIISAFTGAPTIP